MTHAGSSGEEAFDKSEGRQPVGVTTLQLEADSCPQTQEMTQLQQFLSLGG